MKKILILIVLTISYNAYTQVCDYKPLLKLDSINMNERYQFTLDCFDDYIDSQSECSYYKFIYSISVNLDSYGWFIEILSQSMDDKMFDSNYTIQLCNLLALSMPISNNENILFPDVINRHNYKKLLMDDVVPFYENLTSNLSLVEKQDNYIILIQELREKILNSIF